jgi:lipopolysaccharide/colanic/teichoic acid biosynthesis glycosyltransferase
MKRAFDFTVATLGLIVFAPVFFVVGVLIKIESSGPAFFKQERIGRQFRPFHIYKFRTMTENAPQTGPAITVGDDARITRSGRFLRRSKIDELPQLINVFKGEMSLVGPRPELSRYVEMFPKDYEEILRVRPGITDMASVKYSNEATLLGYAENPEEKYVTQVLPDKITLAKAYTRQASLCFDVALIFKTLVKLFDSGRHLQKG